jgi:hypothetical protein
MRGHTKGAVSIMKHFSLGSIGTNGYEPSSKPGWRPLRICCQTVLMDSDARISCQWLRKNSIST